MESEKKFRFTKKTALCALGVVGILIVGAVTLFSGKNDMDAVRFYAMDTSVSVKTLGGVDKAYQKKVKELDGLLDCYDKESEIFKLNKNGEAKLSENTSDLLEKAYELTLKYPQCDITAGALIDLWDVTGNPKVPGDEEIKKALSEMGIERLSHSGREWTLSGGKVNLGCCAKGYACDVLKEMFEEKGEKCAIASFGSSSVLYGKKPDGEKFTVAIKNPLDSDKSIGVLKTDRCFVSTSGGYERFFEVDGTKYSHIFDLETGKPAKTDLLSVTVIGQNGTESDFLSTCIYITGTKELPKWLLSEDFSVIAVDENKNVYVSEALKDSFELKDKAFTLR